MKREPLRVNFTHETYLGNVVRNDDQGHKPTFSLLGSWAIRATRVVDLRRKSQKHIVDSGESPGEKFSTPYSAVSSPIPSSARATSRAPASGNRQGLCRGIHLGKTVNARICYTPLVYQKHSSTNALCSSTRKFATQA